MAFANPFDDAAERLGELDRATAALAEVMARPIEAYSSGEAASSNFGQALDAKDAEVMALKKELAEEKYRNYRLRCRLAVALGDNKVLKLDVKHWKDLALQFQSIVTDGASSSACAPNSDEEYKPHII